MDVFVVFFVAALFGWLIFGSFPSGQPLHKRRELLSDDEVYVYEFICKIAERAGFQVHVKYTLEELTQPQVKSSGGERMAVYQKMGKSVIDFVITDRRAFPLLLVLLVPEHQEDAAKSEQQQLANYISSQTEHQLLLLESTPAGFAELEEAVKHLRH